jgi:hypothetical protein
LTEVLRDFLGTFAEHKRSTVTVRCHLARLRGPAKIREWLADFAECGDGA